MADAVFEACSYLPWERFGDSQVLAELTCRAGIISNFNATLREKLDLRFPSRFEHIFVSEQMDIAKPSTGFYQRAIDTINVEPAEIVYVGDSVKLDLEPALQLGMQAYLIDRDNYFPAQPNRLQSLWDLKNLMA